MPHSEWKPEELDRLVVHDGPVDEADDASDEIVKEITEVLDLV